MKLNNSDIQKLKEKGVDPAIILDLLLEEEQAPADPAPEEKKDPAPEEKKDPAPEVKKDPAPEKKQDIQDMILKSIEKLTGAIQTSNLLNSGSNGPDVDTTEAALASIINPTGGK